LLNYQPQTRNPKKKKNPQKTAKCQRSVGKIRIFFNGGLSDFFFFLQKPKVVAAGQTEMKCHIDNKFSTLFSPLSGLYGIFIANG